MQCFIEKEDKSMIDLENVEPTANQAKCVAM